MYSVKCVLSLPKGSKALENKDFYVLIPSYSEWSTIINITVLAWS